MSRNQLRNLRVTYVGTLALIIFMSVFEPVRSLPDLIANADPQSGLLSLAGVFVLGVAYYQLGVRGWIEPGLWNRVNENIHERLLTAAGHRGLLIPRTATMKVFYQLIDRDPTLKSHADGVYFNGLIVTALIDTSFISLTFSIVHSALSVASIGDRTDHLIWALLLLAVDLAASLAAVGALRRHQQLSDVQLDLIAAHHSAEARQLLSAQLHRLR